MKVFPEWVKELGIDTEIKGIDIAIHEKPEVYREVVDFIKHDPLYSGCPCYHPQNRYLCSCS